MKEPSLEYEAIWRKAESEWPQYKVEAYNTCVATSTHAIPLNWTTMRREYERQMPNYKPITNADRIRVMTDEELAEYLDGVCHDLWQMFVKDPQKMWLDWLKQEADT